MKIKQIIEETKPIFKECLADINRKSITPYVVNKHIHRPDFNSTYPTQIIVDKVVKNRYTTTIFKRKKEKYHES